MPLGHLHRMQDFVGVPQLVALSAESVGQTRQRGAEFAHDILIDDPRLASLLFELGLQDGDLSPKRIALCRKISEFAVLGVDQAFQLGQQLGQLRCLLVADDVHQRRFGHDHVR